MIWIIDLKKKAFLINSGGLTNFCYNWQAWDERACVSSLMVMYMYMHSFSNWSALEVAEGRQSYIVGGRWTGHLTRVWLEGLRVNSSGGYRIGLAQASDLCGQS